MTQDPYRLPAAIEPRHYTIEIRPDLDGATFSGDISIDMEVRESTAQVVLNVLDLELDDVELNGVAPDSVTLDPGTERVVIGLDQPLSPGPASLHISFRGVLNDKLMGFYRSTFDLSDPATGTTEQRTIAVTQFESTHARAAFPCFDEPAMKATFAISLVIDENLFAVSNGAEVSRESVGDGRVRIEFAETMPMSTYLVAFVVGPLVATEPRMVDGASGPIPLRVVHRPGSEHLCDFALDVAEAALLYFEDYYGIPYPGDKVDLVAVPDFAFGAMENLGCITFREVLLLVDPDRATQPELQRVADVINHELAHMWFGDLVTMKWWNGIWLNEAFATFMENMASDAFDPGWDVWTTFGLARAAAFDTDALSTTRPIEYTVVSPADSEGMFDVLTYEKGASVVRMLEQYLGAETFRRGISAYLTEHSYGVTETTDLWDALEHASGEPVRRIMDGWIFQGGHPNISVSTTSSGVRLSQRRFTYGAGDTDGSSIDADDAVRWAVPMSIEYRMIDPTAGNSSQYRLLLEDDIEVDLGGEPAMVRVNTGGTGFFRSDLEPDLLMALAAEPDSSPLERFVLIDDACAGLDAGSIEVDVVWTLLEVVARTETEPAVWRRIASALRELHHLLGPSFESETVSKILSITNPGLQRVRSMIVAQPGAHTGSSGTTTQSGTGADSPRAATKGSGATESVTVQPNSPGSSPALERAREIRGILAALRGTIGSDPHVREHTAQVFLMDTADGMSREPGSEDAPNADIPSVDAALRAAAIEVVGYNATPDQHEELVRRWRAAPTPQDELRYLTALVDTADPELFTRTLNLILNDVRSQNAPYLLQRAIAHRAHATTAWDFIEENWDVIIERFPTNSLPRMLAGIRSTTDRRLAERIDRFTSDNPVPAGGQQVDQHIERMWVTVRSAERLRS